MKNAKRLRRTSPLIDRLEPRTLFATHPLSALPAVNSYASGKATLFLDFDGAPSFNYGLFSKPATPAYDSDGDPTTYSDQELAEIRSIVGTVAEKYSPFNVNVTTVDPGTYPGGQVLRVLIGGSSSTEGTAQVGSFNSTTGQNAVFVYSAGRGVEDIAVTIAHEAGHAFGLQHQSLYDSSGNLLIEYNPGDAQHGPIMGGTDPNARATWWYGPNIVSATSIQDDLAIIAGATNGFGYRADDYGNDMLTATPISGGTVNASGVIGTTSDADYFSFATAGGTVSLTANPYEDSAVYGKEGMLDLKLQILNTSGQIVANADSGLGETLSASLPAGTYFVVVASHGAYGDVGQYTLTGTIPLTATVIPDAPTNATATAISSSQIKLNWTGSSGANQYVIQRFGAGWEQVATVGSATTSWTDSGLNASTTYYYEVLALNGAGYSGTSNLVAATTPLAATVSTINAPTGLTGVLGARNRMTLKWTDNATNETGYLVLRSTDGQNWTQIANLGADSTTYVDASRRKGTTYYYTVVAYNGTGSSSPSNTVAG